MPILTEKHRESLFPIRLCLDIISLKDSAYFMTQFAFWVRSIDIIIWLPQASSESPEGRREMREKDRWKTPCHYASHSLAWGILTPAKSWPYFRGRITAQPELGSLDSNNKRTQSSLAFRTIVGGSRVVKAVYGREKVGTHFCSRLSWPESLHWGDRSEGF